MIPIFFLPCKTKAHDKKENNVKAILEAQNLVQKLLQNCNFSRYQFIACIHIVKFQTIYRGTFIGSSLQFLFISHYRSISLQSCCFCCCNFSSVLELLFLYHRLVSFHQHPSHLGQKYYWMEMNNLFLKNTSDNLFLLPNCQISYILARCRCSGKRRCKLRKFRWRA